MLHTARRVSIFSKLMTSRSRILHAVHGTVHRQPLPGLHCRALQQSAPFYLQIWRFSASLSSCSCFDHAS